MKTFLRFLLLFGGLGVFAFFVQQTGPGEIWRSFSKLGPYVPLVLLPYGLVYVVDCTAWKVSFGRGGVPGVGFGSLLRVRWSGESFNNVIPSGYLGGEALKVYLLHKRGISPVRAGSAAVISKSCQTLAMVLFVATGTGLALRFLPPGSNARCGMAVITGLAFLGILALFWLQRHGLFTVMIAVLRRLRLRIAALEKRASHLRQVDRQVLEFYRRQKRFFLGTIALYYVGWLADTLEILVASHLLGYPIDWTLAVSLEALISVVKAIGLFVPGAVGIQESGVVLAFRLFGLPPGLGVSYAILRRGRDLCYAAVGWSLLYAEEVSLSGLSRRVRMDAGD